MQSQLAQKNGHKYGYGNYARPSDYKGTPKSISEQSDILREILPGIGWHDGRPCNNEEFANMKVPKGAEGLFAIPPWQLIAPTHIEATRKVFDMLGKYRSNGFSSLPLNDFGRLRESSRKVSYLERIAEDQAGNDIYVIPAQFGLAYRDFPVQKVRKNLRPDEFSLGIYETSIMLLTHPERMHTDHDLWLHMLGDEFRPHGEPDFSDIPTFSHQGDVLTFRTSEAHHTNDNYGSVTAFWPE